MINNVCPKCGGINIVDAISSIFCKDCDEWINFDAYFIVEKYFPKIGWSDTVRSRCLLALKEYELYNKSKL